MASRKKRWPTRDLCASIERGDNRAISRAISIIHDNRPQRRALVQALREFPRASHRIGITGAQGNGKSTLISALTRRWGKCGKTIGILAIDPTSRETGGAELADHVHMSEYRLEPWFFLRSLATRNNKQGIVARLDEMLLVLSAARKDYAIVETIGASQDAVDIREYVDTLVYILLPTGDAMTYQKAGLIDVADIFVVNRASIPGAQQSTQQLIEAIRLYRASPFWTPPTLTNAAFQNAEVEAIADAIDRHKTIRDQQTK